jgi:hypothetical protein
MSRSKNPVHLRRIEIALGAETFVFRLNHEMLAERNEVLQNVRRMHSIAAGIVRTRPPAQIPSTGACGESAAPGAAADAPTFPWDLYDGSSPRLSCADVFDYYPDPFELCDN